jgi:multiple sugar transport system permease protein
MLNDILIRWGFIKEALNWLGSPKMAMIAVIIANVWKYYPFNMMLLMGGLQSISPALKEAADIDGASGWQQFFRVTLPLLRPVMFVTVMLNIVHAFNAFTVVHVMTGGGPLRATEIFPLLIHRLGFVSLSFERASAAAGLLFLTVAFAIALYTWTFWKESEI